MFANCCSWPATAAMSAVVAPVGALVDDDGRDLVAGLEPAPSAWSTSVDSASPGSHETASFSCAPVSLPAGENASTSATTQNARISHFDRRPEANRASRPAALLETSLTGSTVLAAGRGVNRQK